MSQEEEEQIPVQRKDKRNKKARNKYGEFSKVDEEQLKIKNGYYK